MSNITNTVAPAPVALFIVVVVPKRGAAPIEVVVEATSYSQARSLAMRGFGRVAEVVRDAGGRPKSFKASPSDVFRAECNKARREWRALAARVEAMLDRMADAGVGDLAFYEDALAMLRHGGSAIEVIDGIKRESARLPPVERIAPLPPGLQARIDREISEERRAGALLAARSIVIGRIGKAAFLEAEAALRREQIMRGRREAAPHFARLAAQSRELELLIAEGEAALGRLVTDRIGAAKAARKAAKAAADLDAACGRVKAANAALVAAGEAARLAEEADRAEDARRLAAIMREFGLA